MPPIPIGDLNGDSNADVVTSDNYNLSALLGDGTGALAADTSNRITTGV
ncbi:MAG TPA: hypothetical protein VMM76_02445 [Pirellulaceae bacterium]|nr:hypothetical protein [Pirellulaceae bacterium]